MKSVISVENLSKSYHLGQIGTGTFSRDLELWWARIRRRPNPMIQIGEETNNRRNGGTVWALKNINFMVGKGEVLGIIGRNGAGKSTLLKILSRVTAPTSGSIKVRGRIASLLEIGTGFHPELTGRENIHLNGAILGMRRHEIVRKFEEIVDFAEVDRYIDTPVKRYSSGMYVRLAFAVAAHLDPEILVVDEVLAVGDAEFQRKCLGKMSDVAREGRTVLFVSHNMGAVRRLCSTGLVLEGGEVEFIGKVEDAVERYLSASSERSLWNATDANTQNPYTVTSIRVLDHNGIECSRFPMGSEVIIEICAEVERSLVSSHMHLMVNYAGAILFRTFDTDDNPHLLRERPAGKYYQMLSIDTTLLKPGLYDISVDIGTRPSVVYEKIVDAVSFALFDPQGDFDRGWSESRQGVIKAPARWRVSSTGTSG